MNIDIDGLIEKCKAAYPGDALWPVANGVIALCERLREAEATIQNALSELKVGDVQSAIDQLEAGNE
ncbi:hypothetical protein [Pseudomonas sp.]|uniref:hypothetical protein n=1 Tax=Pseudomonas sp. TaxID=306 RepID=UPI00289F2916|nr:hypothetical protein [Pseudomonas sp.]